MDKLVTVTTFLNINEAYLAKGMLESKGIEARVFDEHAAAYAPFLGEIRLVVKLSDLEKAREILFR